MMPFESKHTSWFSVDITNCKFYFPSILHSTKSVEFLHSTRVSSSYPLPVFGNYLFCNHHNEAESSREANHLGLSRHEPASLHHLTRSASRILASSYNIEFTHDKKNIDDKKTLMTRRKLHLQAQSYIMSISTQRQRKSLKI